MIDYMFYGTLCIPLFALILDTIIGDPHVSFHPVALIGKVISFYEKIFYYAYDRSLKKGLYGFLLVLFVLLTVAVIYGIIVGILGYYTPIGVIIFQVFVVYISISPQSLASSGIEIASALFRHNLEIARHKLSWIVGRDTDHLDEGDIARGAVETIAENTVDGVIGPLLFFAIFGPLGALLYRTINTLDSMVGYKNERYLYFGRFAAKLDDLVNLIPARITGLLLVLSAFLLKKDGKKAFSIMRRDAHKHPSPNGGYAEAPVAGALHIRLGGPISYGGHESFRAYMGDALVPTKGKHILQAGALMYIATFLGTLLSMVLYYMIYAT